MRCPETQGDAYEKVADTFCGTRRGGGAGAGRHLAERPVHRAVQRRYAGRRHRTVWRRAARLGKQRQRPLDHHLYRRAGAGGARFVFRAERRHAGRRRPRPAPAAAGRICRGLAAPAAGCRRNGNAGDRRLCRARCMARVLRRADPADPAAADPAVDRPEQYGHHDPVFAGAVPLQAGTVPAVFSLLCGGHAGMGAAGLCRAGPVRCKAAGAQREPPVLFADAAFQHMGQLWAHRQAAAALAAAALAKPAGRLCGGGVFLRAALSAERLAAAGAGVRGNRRLPAGPVGRLCCRAARQRAAAGRRGAHRRHKAAGGAAGRQHRPVSRSAAHVCDPLRPLL